MKSKYIAPDIQVYHVDLTVPVCQSPTQYGTIGNGNKYQNGNNDYVGGGDKGGGWSDYENPD